MYLELVSLRQYGNRCCRGVHTSLRLRGGHTLYAVYARLILQRAIHVGPRDGKVYLLVAAHGTLADAGDGELPALRVAERLVHLEQVARKQGSLVATRSGTDFHLDVLRVLGVLRNQCNLDFLLQLRLQGLVVSQFLTSHLLHLRIRLVGQDVLGLLDAVQTGYVALAGVHDVAQVLVFLRQFHETLLVGYDLRVGNQR